MTDEADGSACPRRYLSDFFDTLADLRINGLNHFLVVTHGVELCHKFDEALDRLATDRLPVRALQHVAKIVFEGYQGLQAHVKVLDLHDPSLPHYHRLLAGELHEDLESALLDQVDLTLGP